MLSEDDILAAVRRSLGGAGTDGAVFPAQGARITRHLLVDGEIVRCVESREERAGFHRGVLDLSDRPAYDDIDRYAIPAPADPGARSTLLLVRRGSVEARACAVCTNGRQHCARCRGAGDVSCPPSVPCAACRESVCCLSCEGTGKRAREAADRPEGETALRVRCRACGAEDTACAKCRGAGPGKCPVCGGTGSRPCPDCEGAGTVSHGFCGGTGRYVEWTEGVIAREPVVDAIKETSSLPARSFGWTNEYDAWARVDLVGEEAVPVAGEDADPELAAFLKPRLGVHDGEVGRRVAVRHLSLARVTHDAHPHRVYIVIPGRAAPRVVPLRSRRRTWQLVGAALLLAAAAVTVARLLA
ncbi:hypothetical protein ACFWIN_30540 [Streptomyces sp. NPDC127049]|uniref:hypothetical protein n=1 Tax=Streptomyces sp. NPDC127049 TaxID=3347118 RepID=UPI003667264F